MGLLVAVGTLAGLGLLWASWAGWRAGSRVDPPYRGIHEPRGRHRAREWR